MKKYVEIDETITRTYRVEVDEEIAQTLLNHNDAFSWYNDVTLDDLLDYHNKGELIMDESEIQYASLTESVNGIDENTTELYYSL